MSTPENPEVVRPEAEALADNEVKEKVLAEHGAIFPDSQAIVEEEIILPDNGTTLTAEDVAAINEASSNVEGEEGLAEGVKAPELKPNAKANRSYLANPKGGSPDTVSIPPCSNARVREFLSATPGVETKTSLTGPQAKWLQAVEDSAPMVPMNDHYQEALDDPACDWRNSLQTPSTEVEPKHLRPGKNEPGTVVLESDDALLAIIDHFAIGGIHKIPLLNSGFWVSFKPGTEPEFLALHERIFDHTVNYGRDSYGLSLSNQTVYYTDMILEHIQRHIYVTNVRKEELPLSDIMKYIKPQDINTLIVGYLCANYASGFKFERPCIKKPLGCTSIEHGTINPRSLMWFDSNKLTESQRVHMASFANGSRTLGQVENYQASLACQADKTVKFGEGTRFEIWVTLSSPSVKKYIEDGHAWVSSLVNMVDGILGKEATSKARNAQMDAQTNAAYLNQVKHWISKITIVSESTDSQEKAYKEVTDPVTLSEQLMTLSSVDSLREGIMKAVQDYIAASSTTIIGVPAYDCPECGTPQEPSADATGKPCHVVPLDALQLFFELLSHRVKRIMMR